MSSVGSNMFTVGLGGLGFWAGVAGHEPEKESLNSLVYAQPIWEIRLR